jgi:uncharacterized protein (DUF433 family)
MAISLAPEVVPLEADAHGILHIANTRVTLDTVVAAFNAGATAEEIVQQYPSLTLADVYQVIGYYLRRPADIEQYLQDRLQQRTSVRQRNEARSGPKGVRGRLLARRKTRS